MIKQYRRTPKNYDGTEVTTRRVSELLPSVLSKVNKMHGERPDLILASWNEIIGPRLAGMTKAVSFIDGVLHVKVKNSTLHSLLSQNDKHRILSNLRAMFPNVQIKTISFRVG